MTASKERDGNSRHGASTSPGAGETAPVNEAVATACATRTAAAAGASVAAGAATSASLEGAARRRRVERGDVRVVEPLAWQRGARRIAVVCRVDPDCEIAEMMLAHPWPELATDTDAVVASEDSGLPFPLVVECYVRNPVWLWQVFERLGGFTESQMNAVGEAVIDDNPMAEGVYTGLPLAGPADARWSFKAQEITEWRTITEDCFTVLLDGDRVWQFDRDRLQPDTYGESSEDVLSLQSRERLAETIHQIATRPMSVAVDDIDTEALDFECWSEHLGRDAGMDVFAAFQPLFDKALSQSYETLQKEAV